MLHIDTKSLHLPLASAPALVLFQGIPEERARQGTNLLWFTLNSSSEISSSVQSISWC